ncbi:MULTISPECIES: helix-turn-helix domain-containing protein [unclassified Burkholderia]|uniref:helix-turn-helix domain-containing protein n=1 Tax=unclassified Burkholderia TaxID=2613784 RepID=UPI002AAF0DBB|nr:MULTISPECIES: helix-turn-helix domain-containing protein [unclassified Burkholderia]
MFYKPNMDLKLLRSAGALGAEIRLQRARLGKSQSDLANAVGVRRQTIADLESGKNVGLYIAMAVLAELKCALSLCEDRAPASSWPANWQVVDDWGPIVRSSRERLEAQMQAAKSAEQNRREAFVLAPLDVRSARVAHYPAFGELGEF